MAFDARAAKSLPPGDHLTVDGAPGLRLVATETRRTWTYRYRAPTDGKLRQVRLGHWPAMGLPAALAAWERMRTERIAGADPAADKRAKRRQAASAAAVETYTVRRACDEYLADYRAGVTLKTYTEAERLLAGELGAIEARPASSITRADAYDLVRGMAGRPVLAVRVLHDVALLWGHRVLLDLLRGPLGSAHAGVIRHGPYAAVRSGA